MGSAGGGKVMKPIYSKAHERLYNTRDESIESVRRWFAEGESFANLYNTAMENFLSMFHKEQFARVDAEKLASLHVVTELTFDE